MLVFRDGLVNGWGSDRVVVTVMFMVTSWEAVAPSLSYRDRVTRVAVARLV